MRTKDDLNKDLFDHNNWSDRDGSRKAHQTDLLIEVFIDIRDILEKGRSAIFGIYDCLANK